MYEDFKIRLLNAAFNLAGTVITQQLGSNDKQQELIDDYHLKALRIAEKAEKERNKTPRKPIPIPLEEPIPPQPEYKVTKIEKDLSPEKIEQGTACLACIPPESIILTESGVKQIEQVSTDDKVLDRYGEYTETLNIIRRRYDGDIISILPTYQTSFPLFFTPKHPILVAEAEMCNKVRGYCIPGKTNKKCTNCNNKKYKLRFLPASDIYTSNRNPYIGDKKLLLAIPRVTKVEDVDVMKIDEILKTGITVKNDKISSSKAYNVKKVQNVVEISPDFMKLVGFYLAEGSVNIYKQGGGCIRFHFGHHEREFANEVVRLIKKSFSIKATIYKTRTTLDVTVCSIILARLFKSLFDTGSANKFLPQWILYLPYEKQYSLLEGYFKGDGAKDDVRNTISAATVSKQLAYYLRQILFRLGILHNFSLRKNNNSKICKSKNKLYQLTITGLSGNILGKKIDYNLPIRKHIRAHEGGIDNNFMYLPIKKIERKTYNQRYVMNLTTHSNTYTCEGACVHNCSRDHFSTASAALNEALRFARKEGINHIEVQRRLGMALDELNICERIDLAAETIERLDGREKEVALEAANDSRDLRHDITAIKTPDDLQKASAQASNIRTKFMTNIFELSTKDGTVEKLCKGLTGEEKQKCITVINNVLTEKKEEKI